MSDKKNLRPEEKIRWALEHVDNPNLKTVGISALDEMLDCWRPFREPKTERICEKPECGKSYRSRHRKQRFCSEDCRNAVKQKAYRERKRDEIARSLSNL